jgi:hypothetical protein
MDEQPVRRRRYLAALGTVASAGLAGCSLSSGTSDATNNSTNRTQSYEFPSESTHPQREFPGLTADEPTFRNWVPGTGEQRDPFVAAFNIQRVREQKAELPAETYEQLASWAMFGGYVGMEYEEIEGFLAAFGLGIVVYTGSVTGSTIRSRLDATSYEQYDQRQGITYYRNSDTEDAELVGVGEQGVVYGDAEYDAERIGQPFIEKTVPLFETARGDRSRLHEEPGLYEEYTDSVGWSLVTYAHLPQFRDPDRRYNPQLIPAHDQMPDEMVAAMRPGYAQYLAEDSIVDLHWLRIAEGMEVTPAEVREGYRTSWIRSQFEEKRLAVRTEGQVVKVALVDQIETAGEGIDPPVVTIGVSIEGETAILDHRIGDPVDLERVVVWVDGERISPGSGTLSPGESVRVDISAADETDEANVVYEFPNEGSIQLGSTE